MEFKIADVASHSCLQALKKRVKDLEARLALAEVSQKMMNLNRK